MGLLPNNKQKQMLNTKNLCKLLKMSEVITYEKFMKIKELDEKDVTVNQDNQMNLF